MKKRAEKGYRIDVKEPRQSDAEPRYSEGLELVKDRKAQWEKEKAALRALREQEIRQRGGVVSKIMRICLNPGALTASELLELSSRATNWRSRRALTTVAREENRPPEVTVSLEIAGMNRSELLRLALVATNEETRYQLVDRAGGLATKAVRLEGEGG